MLKSIPRNESYVNGDKKDVPKSPYEQAREYYACQHEKAEIRFKVYKNDSHHYFEQCLNCGEAVGSAIPHKEIDAIDDTPPWDERLQLGYRFAIDEMANKIRAEQQQTWRLRNTDWDREYDDYIKTPLWKDKRRRVLERDNYTCQACLKRPAQQAHHLNYRFPLGKEPLFVLISVCQACHEAIHELTGRGVQCD